MTDATLHIFDVLPQYTTCLSGRASPLLMWSGSEPIPRIGDDVILRINAIGRGRVISYAAHFGYLGLMVMPYAPPDWWIAQNGKPTPERPGLAFGAEIALADVDPAR